MFHLKSEGRATRVAKDLDRLLKERGVDKPHHQLLNTVARLYGWKDWAVLRRSVGTAPASKDDWECEPDEVERRRALHDSVLAEFIPERRRREVLIEQLSPTNRTNRDAIEDAQRSDPMLAKVLEAVQRERAGGNPGRAAKICAIFIEKVLPPGRRILFDLLEELSPQDTAAAINFAMALVFGEGGKVEIERGRSLLETTSVSLRTKPIDDESKMQLAFINSLLGDIAGGSHGGTADQAKALVHYKAAATFGNGQAAFNAGLILALGKTGPVDLEGAAAYYRKGAELGYPQAMTNLALMVVRKEIDGDPEEALDLLQEASRLGDHNATGFLAARINALSDRFSARMR